MTDQTWAGCIVPDDLLYDVACDVWVRREDDEVVLGMTDVAQTASGRLVQITWLRVGRTVDRHRPLAAIESAKWVGPFPTPLSGVLVAVNAQAFGRDIAVANRDPYGAGWLARVRPTRWEQEAGLLVDGRQAFEHYRQVIAERKITCFRCAEQTR
ncbi:MAG: glycine cleavage system protein H [Actinomycetes bacterium]